MQDFLFVRLEFLKDIKLLDWFKSNSNFNDKKVKSQIIQLHKDSFEKSNERTFVSEFAIFTQKWTKI